VLIDLHVHSAHTPEVPFTLKELVDRAKQAGLDGLALTDVHSVAGLAEARELSRSEGLPVLVGFEAHTTRGHFLVFVPEPEKLPDISTWLRFDEQGRCSYASLFEAVEQLDGILVAAHPFDRSVPESPGDSIVRLEGVSAIEVTLSGINKIAESANSASDVIQRLGSRIDNIGSILEVIVEVASQTKLLALNAAIIASQAGEHGRGFSVLAEQIKELAARTNTSASEISELIRTIQEESNTALAVILDSGDHVREGVQLGQEAATVLRKIHDSANRASHQVGQITAATVEQARATKRVLDSVDRIATNVQEINRAANERARERLSRELFESILAAVPDGWLALGYGDESPDEVRGHYLEYLLARLAASSAFVEEAARG